MQQAQLESTAEAGRKKLSGVIDVDEEEDFEILGATFWSTTGEVLVPRGWLEEAWESYGLPEDLFPSEVWPSSVYKRTIFHLDNHELEEKYINGHKTKFRFEEGEGYVRHLYCDVYFSEEEIGESGGVWRSRKLGFFDYNATDQKLEYYTEIDNGDLGDEWKKIIGKAQGLYKKISESHNGQDLTQVIRDMIDDHAQAVPLRTGGVVYFTPHHYANMVDNFASLWEDLNQFKKKGKRCEIVALPVIDSRSHRNLVKTHAEELINSKTEKVVDAALERMTQNEEETAEEIAKSVVEELSDTQDVAAQYSALLEAELSIKRHLEDYLGGLEGEKEEMIEEVSSRIKT